MVQGNIIDIRLHEAVQPRTIDQLCEQTLVDGQGKEYRCVSNDIYLLVRQNKLAALNPMVQSAVQNEFARVGSTLSDTAKALKISDSDLLKTVKSRYIQSTCDMSSYVKAMSKAVKDTVSSYRSYLDSKKSEESAPAPAPSE
ncbi:hypothetical protein [Dipodfec virus RodF1_24]|uniref:Uncharacterized protein n=1 Tax=Dipodfec virus RodF1_24 TaxID=2929294 RepID=A0A976N2S3_9VIRU|nr:hypothetical protein [Dipodfec virus RodF1_24]